MTDETKQAIARSLTADTTELIPFLPYLLQDFWELGSDPDAMLHLIISHVPLSPKTRILDLACGKGAVAVKVAEALRVKVKGIDILPEFINYARLKACEHHVTDLCEFATGDINEAVKTEKAYDVVIFGAAGIALGEPAEMLSKLKSVVCPGGYILIDECYLPDNVQQCDIKCNSYELLTGKQWTCLFEAAGLELIETISEKNADIPASGNSEAGMAFILARANELSKQYLDKKVLFDGYVQGQINEYDDIDNTLICVTWMLRKF